MPAKPLILALNHNQRNLDILIKILGEAGYEVGGVSSPAELDREVDIRENINLVLIDISGFNRNIWESCERLRILEIPFLVLSPHHHQAVEKQSMVYGANGFLVKPLVVKELLLLIKSLIEE
ncbi:response regulator [uncultured Methanobacterium sp.]|uniref:response regulator n=1 Tax=uncultured Methanobacterium sp. TaxID=176306 RepID=UPI002AA92EB5|nr:response regulator [uncultured Methanobacterium sp.]